MKIVIFCGGYGTRMWPASRKSSPKQFFPLLSGKSFFQITLERFLKQYSPEDIIVSTERSYIDFVHTQAPQIPQENVFAEPERRDNLAAIGLTVALLQKRYPNEVLFFSWSDHIIQNEEKFLSAVKTASDYTLETGRPVLVNQKPTFASVHNGWIKMGKKVTEVSGEEIYEIDEFIEKPSHETAEKLFASPEYLMHTGYGAWRADILMGYFKSYALEAFSHLDTIANAYGTDSFDTVLTDEYGKIEKISIDYGLFEKMPARERLTIGADFGWKDVGTWQLMFESLAESPTANLVEGDVKTTFMESEGNLVVGGEKKMIALIGLSNIAVVDTPHGLLVCSLEKTGEVKKLFAQLEQNEPEFVK